MNSISMQKKVFAIACVIIIAILVSCKNSVAEAESISACETDAESISISETDAVEAEPIRVCETDAEIIAQILYHECRYLPELEQSAVVWVILNRVDSELSYFPDTIDDVCKQKIGSVLMFAYRENAPVEEDLYLLAVDVLTRWEREKRGETDVGRTLPREYLYFWGDGKHNHFRKEYQGKQYWDWSLPSPYEEVQP